MVSTAIADHKHAHIRAPMVEVDLASRCNRHGKQFADNHLHGVEPVEGNV
jgi:hypothetical protein